MTGGRSIDLSTLAKLSRLTTLTVTTERVKNLATLREHQELRRLALIGGFRATDFAGFSSDWQLDTLTLAGAGDLKDLFPLAFLVNPHEIRPDHCSGLRSLDGSRRSGPRPWTNSRCGTAPRPPWRLTRLRRPTELDLYGSPVTDLTPLTDLPRLERLVVSSSRTLRDLAPVPRMPHLRTLGIAEGGPVNLVNLVGLTGVRDLVIQIEGMTRVSGEAALGEGSRVERVGTLHATETRTRN